MPKKTTNFIYLFIQIHVKIDTRVTSACVCVNGRVQGARSVDPNMISPGTRQETFMFFSRSFPFDKLNDHLNMISLEK